MWECPHVRYVVTLVEKRIACHTMIAYFIRCILLSPERAIHLCDIPRLGGHRALWKEV